MPSKALPLPSGTCVPQQVASFDSFDSFEEDAHPKRRGCVPCFCVRQGSGQVSGTPQVLWWMLDDAHGIFKSRNPRDQYHVQSHNAAPSSWTTL